MKQLPPNMQNENSGAPSYYMDQFYWQQDNWLWIRVPKNASMSIWNMLEIPEAGLFPLEEINFDNVSQAFMITRNPFSRIYSCWNNRIMKHRKMDTNRAFTRLTEFESFVYKICETPDDKADHHFRSQSWFIENVPTSILTVPIENLSSEIHLVHSMTGITNPLPHIKRSMPRKELPANTYNEKMIKMMYERYEEDFRRFNYE